MKITLFLEACDKRNATIRSTLASAIGEDLEEVTCPPGTSDWYQMPFVRTGDGTAYFGMQGIQILIDQARGQSLAHS